MKDGAEGVFIRNHCESIDMYIEVDGALLHTVSFGMGERNFLAHSGFVATWEVWLQTFELLSRKWHCAGYDHRGAGESPFPLEKITREAMVEDVFRVMDTLDMEKCILAGESMGGQIVMRAALRYPERFDGIVLVDSDDVNSGPLSDAAHAFISALRTNHPQAIKGFVDGCLPETNSEHYRRWGTNMCMKAGLEATIRMIECGEEGSTNYDPKDIQVPTLIIHGNMDQNIPLENSMKLAEVIPNSELRVVEGAGHVPIVTRTREVVSAIESFFE